MAEQDVKNPEEQLLQAIFGRSESTPTRSPDEQAKLKDVMENVMKTLTYREREIIKLRYGLGDGVAYTLEETGRIFKVTRERIRQIEAKALRKMQHPTRASKFEEFFLPPSAD